MQDREILPEGVGDLPVFDFISHFYQLFSVSCLFDSYVLLADDHVSYFPFMSIKKVIMKQLEWDMLIQKSDFSSSLSLSNIP